VLFDRLAAVADGDGRYEIGSAELAGAAGCDADQLAALLGHLATAEVVEPRPTGRDLVAGRIASPFNVRADARCRSSMGEAARARWRQYREIWAYVENESCRRLAILRHFGDPAAPRKAGLCCDVCDPGLLPEPPAPEPESFEDLDEAILSVARAARPAVGRTTCAAILHGARSQKIERNSYDGLPAYGVSSHMRRADILARIDELIEGNRLATTGGKRPVLRVPAASIAA
jgi:ATP-dependent DNA helicase RecQ